MALSPGVEWTGDYILDYARLLPRLHAASPGAASEEAAACSDELDQSGAGDASGSAVVGEDDDEPVFSLLTGRLLPRSGHASGNGSGGTSSAMHAGGALTHSGPGGSAALSLRGDYAVARTGAEALARREYRGLAPRLGEHAPALIVEGRAGIASSFTGEGSAGTHGASHRTLAAATQEDTPDSRPSTQSAPSAVPPPSPPPSPPQSTLSPPSLALHPAPLGLLPSLESAALLISGLPWETSREEVNSIVHCRLGSSESGCSTHAWLGEELSMLFDRGGRPSGSALLRCPSREVAERAAAALTSELVHGRYLTCRIVGGDEAEKLLHKSNAGLEWAAELAAQSFGAVRSTRPQPPAGHRDFLVLVHDAPAAFVEHGRLQINDLPAGRVDLLARCVAATLFYSHGVRKNARAFLLFGAARRLVSCDGQYVKGLRPDERCVASALSRTLAGKPPAGWSVHDGVDLREVLSMLTGDGHQTDACKPSASSGMPAPRTRLLVMHEQGRAVSGALGHSIDLSTSLGSSSPSSPHVIVLGDHLGFTVEEEAILDAHYRVSLSPLPMLTSQCITISHWMLDCQTQGAEGT